MKKLWKSRKSRTMLFSGLLVVFGAVEVNLSMVQHLIDPKWWGLIVMVIGIITAWLRWVTTNSLDDK